MIKKIIVHTNTEIVFTNDVSAPQTSKKKATIMIPKKISCEKCFIHFIKFFLKREIPFSNLCLYESLKLSNCHPVSLF